MKNQAEQTGEPFVVKIVHQLTCSILYMLRISKLFVVLLVCLFVCLFFSISLSIGMFADRSYSQSVGRSVVRSVGRSVELSIGLFGWHVGRPVVWLVDRSIDLSVDPLACRWMCRTVCRWEGLPACISVCDLSVSKLPPLKRLESHRFKGRVQTRLNALALRYKTTVISTCTW